MGMGTGAGVGTRMGVATLAIPCTGRRGAEEDQGISAATPVMTQTTKGIGFPVMAKTMPEKMLIAISVTLAVILATFCHVFLAVGAPCDGVGTAEDDVPTWDTELIRKRLQSSMVKKIYQRSWLAGT
jgi:hypothetical protein